MRELRETGRMPHHARVVASSFLVKDLLVDWRIGEQHLRHLLVDGDPAQNAGNWQAVAGTGNDAAAPNRVIDPVEHSRRHDPSGAYIRRWVPELADLDDESIHAPWTADEERLATSGIRLGRDYPDRIVDHAVAREAYLTMIRGIGATSRARASIERAPSVPDVIDRRSDNGDAFGARDARPDPADALEREHDVQPPAAAS
jgi:deoxyribodipyrimidine photo-lyase